MQDVNYQLFSDNVREELLIGLDETDAGITAQANQVMADLDLAAFVERHPMSLSGGQKQRVAIGSALMCGKDLIILDEPTSGLDRYHMETDSTAFDITDWLGEWESFEHYIDSDDAAIQQTWEAAEQAVLANPKMAPMAARGIKTFWSMAFHHQPGEHHPYRLLACEQTGRRVQRRARHRMVRRGPLRHHPRTTPPAVDLATYGGTATPRWWDGIASVAMRVQILVIKAEIMADLVQHGFANLLA